MNTDTGQTTRIVWSEASFPDGDRLVAVHLRNRTEPAGEPVLAHEDTAFELDELDLDMSMSTARAVPRCSPADTAKLTPLDTHRVIQLPVNPDQSASGALEEALLTVEIAITATPEVVADMIIALERRGAELKRTGHVSASQMFAAKRDILVDLALGRSKAEIPDLSSQLLFN
jgi:hypothetical protein